MHALVASVRAARPLGVLKGQHMLTQRDHLSSRRTAMKLNEHLKKSSIMGLADAGHFPMEENPEGLAKMIDLP